MKAKPTPGARPPQRRRARVDGRRIEAVRAVCRVLTRELKSVHGLSRNAVKLLDPAACFVGVLEAWEANEWRQRMRAAGRACRGLPPGAERTATAAARLALAGDVTRARQKVHRGRTGSVDSPSLQEQTRRLAAVLRLALGLVSDRGATRLESIEHSPTAVLVRLRGDARRHAAGVLRHADLWNAVMLRPLRLAPRARGGRGSWAGVPGTMGEALRRVLREQVETVLTRAYGVERVDDPEYVHEMRVASRRARAALRVFRDTASPWAPFEADLQRLGRVLGGARDADVFVAFLEAEAGRLSASERRVLAPLLDGERRRRRQRYGLVRRVLQSETFARLAEGLYPALCRGARGRTESLARGAVPALARALKRLRRHGGRLSAMTATDVHELRLACKRLRYAAEFLEVAFEGGLRPMIKRLMCIQDGLGCMHDAEVYRQRLRRPVPGAADEAGGRRTLARVERRLDAAARAAMAEAQACWSDFRKREYRDRLRKGKRPL